MIGSAVGNNTRITNIYQKELSDFSSRNQIALYSWIILKCCHFVVTGQFPSAKVQHFQGFSAFRVLFPLVQSLRVKSLVISVLFA